MVEMRKDERYSSERQWYYKETLTSAGPGEAIRIPAGDLTSIGYQLEGDGTVQITAYPYADINNDTAVWSTVEDGAQINPSISAIRQTNISGTTVLNVRCQ